METTLYVIEYWNGESYNDAWSGILVDEECFSDAQMAENRIKQLQIDRELHIADEIAQGYMYFPEEQATWKVVPITLHS